MQNQDKKQSNQLFRLKYDLYIVHMQCITCIVASFSAKFV